MRNQMFFGLKRLNLTVFFSQSSHKWQVVLGQYLAFTLWILVSLIGFFGGRVLPHEWIRLLGLAPIFLGVKEKRQRYANEHKGDFKEW